MAFCHNCGKEIKGSAKFCRSCGTKTKEKSSEATISHHKKRRVGIGSIILICFVVIILYLILNVWAIGQIEIDTSASSIINSIASFNFNTGLLKTELGTEIRISNPTIIPVLITKVSYDLHYGDRIMGEGGTGFIFIMPKSYVDTPVDFELSHVETGLAVVEGIINIFQEKKKSLGMNFYAGFGPINIPVGVLE